MADQTRAKANGADPKDIYVYDYDVSNRCVEVGVTRDLGARRQELIREYGGFGASITWMGDGPMTRADAERELKEMAEIGYPVNMDTLKQI